MKRLVFCFDGTWNRLDSQCPTNVVVVAESTLPLARGNVAQLIYYHEGVGTGRWDRVRGGVFGSGLVQNLADAYRFLIFNYTAGDEIYVFGFSRGAYTARSFAGLVSNCGILLRKNAALVGKAITAYQSREPSEAYRQQMLTFRRDNSPHVCVSDAEDHWRASNVAGYVIGQTCILKITYLGVWDTVGALGIPASFSVLSFANARHKFHDTNLSDFVTSARHAVAIDERRKDFRPTLWENLDELNLQRNAKSDSPDAPYQQKWFPGTHSSVGGGGQRRGLSDQALDWVLDGARHMGLELDSSKDSRIYELAPDYSEFLENSETPGIMYRVMNRLAAADRQPGPKRLFEVSQSARRRWAENPDQLRDGKPYRPGTLAGVSKVLDSLNPESLGVGEKFRHSQSAEPYELHTVLMGETLGAIAQKHLGDAKHWNRIHTANLDKIEDPNRIYPGQILRIPTA
jgi:uncharacterized protein (DUF2235 family)